MNWNEEEELQLIGRRWNDAIRVTSNHGLLFCCLMCLCHETELMV